MTEADTPTPPDTPKGPKGPTPRPSAKAGGRPHRSPTRAEDAALGQTQDMEQEDAPVVDDGASLRPASTPTPPVAPRKGAPRNDAPPKPLANPSTADTGTAKVDPPTPAPAAGHAASSALPPGALAGTVIPERAPDKGAESGQPAHRSPGKVSAPPPPAAPSESSAGFSASNIDPDGMGLVTDSMIAARDAAKASKETPAAGTPAAGTPSAKKPATSEVSAVDPDGMGLVTDSMLAASDAAKRNAAKHPRADGKEKPGAKQRATQAGHSAGAPSPKADRPKETPVKETPAKETPVKAKPGMAVSIFGDGKGKKLLKRKADPSPRSSDDAAPKAEATGPAKAKPKASTPTPPSHPRKPRKSKKSKKSKKAKPSTPPQPAAAAKAGHPPSAPDSKPATDPNPTRPTPAPAPPPAPPAPDTLTDSMIAAMGDGADELSRTIQDGPGPNPAQADEWRLTDHDLEAMGDGTDELSATLQELPENLGTLFHGKATVPETPAAKTPAAATPEGNAPAAGAGNAATPAASPVDSCADLAATVAAPDEDGGTGIAPTETPGALGDTLLESAVDDAEATPFAASETVAETPSSPRPKASAADARRASAIPEDMALAATVMPPHTHVPEASQSPESPNSPESPESIKASGSAPHAPSAPPPVREDASAMPLAELLGEETPVDDLPPEALARAPEDAARGRGDAPATDKASAPTSDPTSAPKPKPETAAATEAHPQSPHDPEAEAIPSYRETMGLAASVLDAPRSGDETGDAEDFADLDAAEQEASAGGDPVVAEDIPSYRETMGLAASVLDAPRSGDETGDAEDFADLDASVAAAPAAPQAPAAAASGARAKSPDETADPEDFSEGAALEEDIPSCSESMGIEASMLAKPKSGDETCDGEEMDLPDALEEDIPSFAETMGLGASASEFNEQGTLMPGEESIAANLGASAGEFNEQGTLMPGEESIAAGLGASAGEFNEQGTLMPGEESVAAGLGASGADLNEQCTLLPGEEGGGAVAATAPGGAGASGGGEGGEKDLLTVWGDSIAGENVGMTIRHEKPGAKKKAAADPEAGTSHVVVKPRSLRASKQGPAGMKPPTKSTGGDAPDYELIDMLGEGGMGVVYKATQTSVDRTVALKMIKPHVAKRADVRDRFIAEAGVTGDLDHPNIVPIHDLGEDANGALFYAMKHVKGKPWDSTIQERSLHENLEILQRTCDAVAFAHDKGVIHRDLKPENVMLGGYGEVLVMDWGLAAAVSDGAKTERLDDASAIGGSPAYMAPEMAEGHAKDIGVASDIYLLGAILFEILTGKAPHTGGNVMECLMNAANNVIQETQVTGELMGIAHKAMATKPEDRYASVQEMQAALKAYQEHEESIVLSDKAGEFLAQARRTGKYDNYARALFGFQQALDLWDHNVAAKGGELVVRREYAGKAVDNGDLDLAESLIPSKLRAVDPFDPLRDRLAEARHKQAVHRRNMRRMKYAFLGAAAVVALSLITVAIVTTINERKAQAARARAETERRRAEMEKQRADAQKEVAEKEKERAQRETERAVAAEAETKVALEETEKQRRRAEEQKRLARMREVEADEANKRAQQLLTKAIEASVKMLAKEQGLSEKEMQRVRNLLLSDKAVLDSGRWSLSTKQAVARQLETARAESLPVTLTIEMPDGVPLALRLIPPGEFVMGSLPTEEDRKSTELPHRVKISQPFYLGMYEVTQAQYAALLGENPSRFVDGPDAADRPVERVSHGDAAAFAAALEPYAPTGMRFRLPTEAEWEYAARAGRAERFHSGTTEPRLKEVAWYGRNSGGATHPVGKKRPNAWGLYDMHGNVAEWCADWFDKTFYLNSKRTDPFNDKPSAYRVVRGGSWGHLPKTSRLAYRSSAYPTRSYDFLGFRIALVKESPKPAPATPSPASTPAEEDPTEAEPEGASPPEGEPATEPDSQPPSPPSFPPRPKLPDNQA